MKNLLKYLPACMLAIFAFAACDDEAEFPGSPGNPEIVSPQVPASAYFADSIPFSATVSDTKVPLSTLKAQLYYGEDKVSETTIRTKTDGTYQGKIYAPFLKNVPDGNATLKLVLQDIHFTSVEQTFTISLQRPQFEYVTLITDSGDSIKLNHSGPNMYKGLTMEDTPKLLKGIIVAPKYGTNGNELKFGWDNGSVKEQSENTITFISVANSPYEVSFNSLTYERSPFVVYILNGKEMDFVDGNFQIDIDLKKGDVITTQNIENIASYWIDPDFFAVSENGDITFNAIDGKYRIIATEGELPYFRVQTLDASGNKATLKADGSGAVWIAGYGIAKPGMKTGQPRWTPGNMLCMAPVEPKKYRMTVVASEEKGWGQIRTDWIGFKFFYQDDWGGEFTLSNYAEISGIIPSIITISNSGDYGLAEGKSLEAGKTYVITLDCTNGPTQASISIVEK